MSGKQLPVPVRRPCGDSKATVVACRPRNHHTDQPELVHAPRGWVGLGTRLTQCPARNLLTAFGIDRAVAYTLLGRAFNVAAGLVTLGIVARRLRPEEQGFYYTFWSIIALYTICELGLTFVITQCASHEMAHLRWTDANTLSGSQAAMMRLAVLLRRALHWYAVAGALVVVAVLPIGFLFFSRNSGGTVIAWRAPWVCVAGGCVFNLFMAPFFATLEGCGRISEMALVRTAQNVAANVGVWATLLLRGGLFAIGVFQLAYFAVGIIWLTAKYRNVAAELLGTDVRNAPFKWRTDVWPFQWRIAISTVSNYVVFQLFNPVLFASHGAVAAGRMGMSLSLSMALLNTAMAWMTTKVAPFGMLAARRQWKQLDDTFFRAFRQSALVLLGASVAVYGAITVLDAHGAVISKRVLAPAPFGALMLSTMMNHALLCQASYLRAHKAEPFLWLSFVSALMTAVSTLVLAKPFGADGICVGYLVCAVISLSIGTGIFIKRRREWHG